MKTTTCGMADCPNPDHQLPAFLTNTSANANPPAPVPSEPSKAGDWLQRLPSAARKEIAMSRALFAFFPDALALIARHSVRSTEKHHPGQPVHWDRSKSSDHEDCILRHSVSVAIDPNSLDDGQPHIVCRAWRSLAALQEWAENNAV